MKALEELQEKYTGEDGKLKLGKKQKEKRVYRTYRIKESIDEEIKYLSERYERPEREIVEICLAYGLDNIE